MEGEAHCVGKEWRTNGKRDLETKESLKMHGLKNKLWIYEIGFQSILKILAETPDFQYFENDRSRQEGALKVISQVVVNVQTLVSSPRNQNISTPPSSSTYEPNANREVNWKRSMSAPAPKSSSSTATSSIQLPEQPFPQILEKHIASSPNKVPSACSGLQLSGQENQLEISIPNPFKRPKSPNTSKLTLIRCPTSAPISSSGSQISLQQLVRVPVTGTISQPEVRKTLYTFQRQLQTTGSGMKLGKKLEAIPPFPKISSAKEFVGNQSRGTKRQKFLTDDPVQGYKNSRLDNSPELIAQSLKYADQEAKILSLMTASKNPDRKLSIVSAPQSQFKPFEFRDEELQQICSFERKSGRGNGN